VANGNAFCSVIRDLAKVQADDLKGRQERLRTQQDSKLLLEDAKIREQTIQFIRDDNPVIKEEGERMLAELSEVQARRKSAQSV
jgi:hypothetical protein